MMCQIIIRSCLVAVTIAMTSTQAQARFIQTDPVGYKDNINLYTYVGDDPANRVDPAGNDAVLVTNLDRTRTVIIPVNFTGSWATPANVSTVTGTTNIDGSRDKVVIMATSNPIQGQLNHVDVSPGYDYHTYPMAGEGQRSGPGVQGTGGNQIHINSDNSGVAGATKHDIMHTAGAIDRYIEGQRDQNNNRTSIPSPGYDNTNIMTDRNGTHLNRTQFNEMVNNPTTKPCTVSNSNACN